MGSQQVVLSKKSWEPSALSTQLCSPGVMQGFLASATLPQFGNGVVLDIQFNERPSRVVGYIKGSVMD